MGKKNKRGKEMPIDRGRASSVEFYSKGLRVEVEYHIEEVSEALRECNQCLKLGTGTRVHSQ